MPLPKKVEFMEGVDVSKLPNHINADKIYTNIKKGSRPIIAEKKLRASGKHNLLPMNRKIEVVALYVLLGNASEVERLTKVPRETINSWRKMDWWHEVMMRIRADKNDELDSKFTKIIDKAVSTIEDRIDNGDYIYTPKDGKIQRKPVNLKDVTQVTSMVLDKRQLLRGEPTSISGKINTDERLKTLQEEFRKFSKARTLTKDEVEVSSVNEILLEDLESSAEPFLSPTDDLNVEVVPQVLPEEENPVGSL